MTVSEAIETIGMQRLAELAGCTRATIDRTKVRGAFSSSPTGARIRQAIRTEGLKLDGDDAGGEQQDLPIDDALSTRLRKQDLAAKAERVRGLRRWKAVRRAVFDRDRWRCLMCGQPGRLECDHVTPLQREPGQDPWVMNGLQTLYCGQDSRSGAGRVGGSSRGPLNVVHHCATHPRGRVTMRRFGR